MILPTGTLLHGGTYRIERDLGQGGFGITYLAEQVMLRRKVAIKEFFMKQYCDRDNISRVSYSTEANKELVSKCKDKFLKEARMIASLEHPNIVKVYDIFEENNTAYYVMEYIDGYPLDKLMEKGAMSEPTAVNYVIQVGKALEYIHNRNILHLDVKPANILLRKNGSIVLIDFGISKHYDSNGNQTSTMQGALSKGYSPLEQGNGLLQDFTAATDVYSLGATLMALLTGQAPPDALSIMNNGLPDCPSNTSSQTWSAIEKAMQPRRKDRTQTVKDFLASLPSVSTANLVTVPTTDSNSEETQVIGQLGSDETVIIKEKQINSNGHEFVDLGLSVKWARCNIGANSEYEKGSTFPFANTDHPNYLPSVISGNKQYDHCFKAWGGDWRLPSKEELDELRQKCKWDYVASQNCYKITGPNGCSIILPITNTVMGLGSVMWPVGCYWSGSFHVTNRNTAYYLYIDNGRNMICWMNEDIKSKYAVRGVIE